MTATRTLRIGTRGSALARAQTQLVADALAALLGATSGGGASARSADAGDIGAGAVELVPIVTHGDRSTEALARIGGTGVFVSALREALLAGEIDVAVHSFKDLPTGPADGIVVAAVPPREDPRDALVSRGGVGLAELAPGSRVGTGSPRRAAQLRALGLGLQVVEIRGNVDTRLAKLDSGLDAVVLALAGLRRLGRDGAVSEILDPIQMLPAPAQGALALECRADADGTVGSGGARHDAALRELVARLDDADTRAAVTAERALLRRLEAGCSAPVGALALVADGSADGAETSEPEIFLRANVTAVDGGECLRRSATGPCTDAAAVGSRLADELLADGAADMITTATLANGPEGRAATLASGPEGRAATLASGPGNTAATLASGPGNTAATDVRGTNGTAVTRADGSHREGSS